MNLALLLHPQRVFRGWWIVYTGTLALILSGGATTYVFSVLVVPMSDDLGWDRLTVVGVAAMSRFVEGFASAPMGPLFDRSREQRTDFRCRRLFEAQGLRDVDHLIERRAR